MPTTNKMNMFTTTTITSLTFSLILLLSLSPSPCTAQNATLPPPIYVFGDSLYDGGMTLFNGVAGAGAEFWPYGETFFKKPVGRYCDGRVIPDFLARYAGLPFPEPYLKPGLTDYSKGINFASAGACVLIQLRPSTINLKKQINYFLKMIPQLKRQVGEAEATRLLSKAVYLFNIAGNDYVTLFQNNLKKTISDDQKTSFMNQILGNITIHIKTIYDQGGRKFAFQNVGPLGCMPSMKYMLGFRGTCMKEPQDLARMHNAAFIEHAKNMQSQFPGFEYSIYDFFTSLATRVGNGPQYGFKESQTGCCGSGIYHGDFTCQKKDKSFSVCSNPNDYLWFDAAHTTDKANQQFAKEFWAASSPVVAPNNLQTLFAL
ncbi:GDSL lipase-like [Silene latifolia]|uniref:GDSL lipase-like n=1 Tax=Silene latifolia TaxID=37657 RepID=UPI003D7800F1